jgi:hypothetical protein
MSCVEFWELTWYEWGLKSLGLIKEGLRRKSDDEFKMELTGQFMALFANVNRDSKKRPAPYTRPDFFKLSYDKAEEDQPQVKPTLETFEQLTERHGSKRKRKNGK